MSDLVLSARNLHKSYREGSKSLAILKGTQLSVASAERVAITGVSGAGKSTLLHLLGGLEQPDAGEIHIAGEALQATDVDAAARIRNRYLGFVYQFHHLLPEFSAIENVAMPLLIRHVKRDEALAQSRELLLAVGLDHRATHRPSELSGGERQRAAIARALVTKPACVLMDEPTGNLDQKTATQIQEVLLELNGRLQIALIIATHNISLAQSMTRVLRLEDGVLQEEQP